MGKTTLGSRKKCHLFCSVQWLSRKCRRDVGFPGKVSCLGKTCPFLSSHLVAEHYPLLFGPCMKKAVKQYCYLFPFSLVKQHEHKCAKWKLINKYNTLLVLEGWGYNSVSSDRVLAVYLSRTCKIQCRRVTPLK